ncbi:MAG TPA: hypothetical protein V6C85_35170 [Allocoleopsis sp.]
MTKGASIDAQYYLNQAMRLQRFGVVRELLILGFLTVLVSFSAISAYVTEHQPSISTTEQAIQRESSPMSNKTIQEVKAEWETQLMAMPGVTGVGISLTKEGQQKCIKVYVNRAASALVGQIPTEIEGYPVEAEFTGTFRAF